MILPTASGETFAADLEKARYNKREGRLQKALTIIDGVLDKDPNFPDALFLRAQILLNGFGNTVASKESLKKVTAQVATKAQTIDN